MYLPALWDFHSGLVVGNVGILSQAGTYVVYNTLAITLLLMLPQFGMTYLMRSVLRQLLPVSEMVKVISLQKGFPNLAYPLSSVPVVLDLATSME